MLKLTCDALNQRLFRVHNRARHFDGHVGSCAAPHKRRGTTRTQNADHISQLRACITELENVLAN
eukprot:2154653-Pyramimonas_sp.AAC.1